MKSNQQLIKIIEKHPFIALEQLIDVQSHLKLPLNEFVILQYLWLEYCKNNKTPSNQYLSELTGIDEDVIRATIKDLMKKKLIQVVPLEHNGKISEEYDLSLLINTIFQQNLKTTDVSNDFKQLVALFEKEFSRQLSSIEIRRLQSWVYDEKVEIAMIAASLEEAVLSGVTNFNYIQTIIKNWDINKQEQYGVNVGKGFNQKMNQPQFSKEEQELADFDWISSLGELDE